MSVVARVVARVVPGGGGAGRPVGAVGAPGRNLQLPVDPGSVDSRVNSSKGISHSPIN